MGGKYLIEGVLGRGGMGVVYVAVNQHTERRVAVKWMLPRFAADPGAATRFTREARMAGRIDHPNVVTIYDVAQDDRTPFLVMELLHGESLSAIVERGPIPHAELVPMIMPALRGIAAAHALGIVHRDLKPDNIFICKSAEGQALDAKVLDFGISKLTEGVPDHRLTATGAVMGTPHYMAPEQIRGVKEIDRRVDVYALGVILYEALSGRLPFQAETYAALAVMIATEEVPPLRGVAPGVPEELEAACTRAMARRPADRFPDVASFAAALEPFAHGIRFDVPTARRAVRSSHAVDASAPTLGHDAVAVAASPDKTSGARPKLSELDITVTGETGAEVLLPVPATSLPDAPLALDTPVAPREPAPSLARGRPRWLVPVAVASVLLAFGLALAVWRALGGQGDVTEAAAPASAPARPTSPVHDVTPATPGAPTAGAAEAPEAETTVGSGAVVVPVAPALPAGADVPSSAPPAPGVQHRPRTRGARATAGATGATGTPAATGTPNQVSGHRSGTMSSDEF